MSSACLLVTILLAFAQDPASLPTKVNIATLHMKDGTKQHGELVAVYQHRLWWHKSQQKTYVIFQPEQARQDEQGNVLQVLSTPDVRKVGTKNKEVGLSYRQFLRQQKIVLEEPPLKGISYVITAHADHHLEEDGYGDFAWDIVKTNTHGQRFRDTGIHNEDYLVWGEKVFLPAAGTVVEVVRDGVDNLPGQYPEDAVNNFVGVHLKGGFYLYLLHFQQGSIPEEIKPGVVLSAGAYLGLVGNSGVSLEPHLHMTLMWWEKKEKKPRYWSVPMEFHNLYARKAKDKQSKLHQYLDPDAETWIAAKPFR